MKSRNNVASARQALARHERKCTICHHTEREAIEEEFVHWRSVSRLAHEYGIEDYRTIYRHARATGLIELRRENIRSALDNIVERSDTTKVSGECILRAIRAYSCIDDMGRWADPPSRVVFTTARVNAPLPAPEAPIEEAVAAELDAASPPEGDNLSPAPLLTCDASPSQQAEYEPVAAGSAESLIHGSGIRNRRSGEDRRPERRTGAEGPLLGHTQSSPNRILIHGSGIRNDRKLMKTHGKTFSNIR